MLLRNYLCDVPQNKHHTEPKAGARAPPTYKLSNFAVFQVESTINQVQEVGSNIFDVARQVIGVVLEAVKPGVDVALPILKQAGEQAVKIASPVVSEFSKKAQETMQSSGIDTQPVISAAKVIGYYFK